MQLLELLPEERLERGGLEVRGRLEHGDQGREFRIDRVGVSDEARDVTRHRRRCRSAFQLAVDTELFWFTALFAPTHG